MDVPTAPNWRRIGGVAGSVGPLVFLAVLGAEGALRAGYDPVRQLISELALGPRGWVQTANFLLLGTTMLLYVRGLALQHGWRAWPRLTLLFIVAAAFFPSAYFKVDPAGAAATGLSTEGAIHLAAGVTIFVLGTLSMVLFALDFWRAPEWRGWRLSTTLVAVWMVALLALFVTSQAPEAPHGAWTGLFQRATIGAFLLWHAGFAVRMLRRTNWAAIRRRRRRRPGRKAGGERWTRRARSPKPPRG